MDISKRGKENRDTHTEEFTQTVNMSSSNNLYVNSFI